LTTALHDSATSDDPVRLTTKEASALLRWKAVRLAVATASLVLVGVLAMRLLVQG
jgi:hypothetical protein